MQTRLDDVAGQQAVLIKKITVAGGADGDGRQADAIEGSQAGRAMLEEARAAVQSSGLDPNAQAPMLRRLDREMADVRQYVAENASVI